MPDDDRLPRSLSGRWHRVLKAFQAGEPQADIEHHVARATAESLRRAHGVPDLLELSRQLCQGASSPLAGLGGAAGGARVLPAHIPARLARRAVDVLSSVMKERMALTSPESAAQMLAHRIVADVAYANGLDRMAPVLMAGGHGPAELRRRFEAIVQSNPLCELARRLLAHPDASGLRAPGQRRPKLATADLMDIDIQEI